MKIYTFKTKQIVKADIHQCWDFFSTPSNLKLITPADMKFEVLSGANQQMFQGQIIEYFVRPLLNIKMKWVTEITEIKHLSYFIDYQKSGPYKLWRHQHFFREVSEGIEMEDIVEYSLPFGFIGQLVHPFLIAPKIKAIFDHRRKAIVKYFN